MIDASAISVGPSLLAFARLVVQLTFRVLMLNSRIYESFFLSLMTISRFSNERGGIYFFLLKIELFPSTEYLKNDILQEVSKGT
jgi:hypothetical protein